MIVRREMVALPAALKPFVKFFTSLPEKLPASEPVPELPLAFNRHGSAGSP